MSKDESYEKHINRYNVIRIDVFGDLLSYDEKNTVQEKTDILFGKKDVAGQKYYLKFLSVILKNRDYLALAYMTGIFPIKKYGDESVLNMVKEISMTNALPLQECTGFTQKEVEALCTKFNRPIEEFEWWYDGYTLNGEHIYNPRSVVESMDRGVSDNY